MTPDTKGKGIAERRRVRLPVDGNTRVCNHSPMHRAMNRERTPDFTKALLLPLILIVSAAGCASSAAKHYSRAQQELAKGRLDAASRELHRCIEKDPAQGDAYLALGKIYFQEEKWSTAANAFRVALRLDPALGGEADPLLIDALYRDALYEVRLGKERAAIDSFGALYERAPDYPGLRKAYTAILLKYGRDALVGGDYPKGVTALKEVLRVDPKNETARLLLDQALFAAN